MGGSDKVTMLANGNLGIGQTNPTSKLEVLDSSATGIISRSSNTQGTDTNKALSVKNNSDTNTFAVSYRGQVLLDSMTDGTNNFALPGASGTIALIEDMTGASGNFVTIATDQTITGKKTFSNADGVTIGSLVIKTTTITAASSIVISAGGTGVPVIQSSNSASDVYFRKTGDNSSPNAIWRLNSLTH